MITHKIENLSYRERYDIWIENNYQTGIEYNSDIDPDFDNEYWIPTPCKKIIIEENEIIIEVKYLTREEFRDYCINNICT